MPKNNNYNKRAEDQASPTDYLGGLFNARKGVGGHAPYGNVGGDIGQIALCSINISTHVDIIIATTRGRRGKGSEDAGGEE